MSVRLIASAIFVVLSLSVAAAAGFSIPSVQAQVNATGAQNPGSIREALEQQLDKRVKLKLVSGQDLEGKVAEVGSEVVIVSELTGMEFFGATVRLDQVAAVVVRTKTQ